MRAHFDKLLTTRPRVGGRTMKGRTPDFEEAPSYQGMRRPYLERHCNKDFGEYLAPLKRFIESKVGHLWDKVYSEIREQITPGNNVHEHILQHVDGYIAIKVVADPNSDTGMAHHMVLGNQNYGRPLTVNPGDLYVDPNDGIIKRAKLLKGRQRVVSIKPVLNKQLEGDEIAVKLNGVWYAVKTVPYNIKIERKEENRIVPGKTKPQRTYSYIETIFIDGKVSSYLTDVIGFTGLSYYLQAHTHNRKYALQERYGKSGVVGVSKRQMKSADLRKYGLVND